MSNFEPRRRLGGAETISGILPAVALPVGLALMISDRDADTGALTLAKADGMADGFLTREVRAVTDGDRPTDVANPRTDTEILFGFGLESPFLAGREGSIERLEAVEVEGLEYIMTSGPNAIDDQTAEGTELSFEEGRFCVAAADQYAQFRLVKHMTPEAEDGIRIYVEMLRGAKVPGLA
jgi:hypothetical protein